MMRSFSVPFDLNTEEKIVGGYFTLKQTIYMVITAIAILSLLLSPLFGSLAEIVQGKVGGILIVLKIVAVVVIAIIGIFFMYLNPHGMSFAKYLIIRVKYAKRDKKIMYER